MIAVQGDSCDNEQHVGWAHTDSAGNYALMGLPPGEYYLRTHNMNQLNVVDEWWTAVMTRAA